MSFLNQLKSQAQALQTRRSVEDQHLEERTAATERACGLEVLRDREVFDYIAMGWRIVPQLGEPLKGIVRVNFPTDMHKVEEPLMLGPVKHERFEVVQTLWPAPRIDHELLDELAKRIVGQPSTFL